MYTDIEGEVFATPNPSTPLFMNRTLTIGKIFFAVLFLLFTCDLTAQDLAGPSEAFRKEALQEIARDNRKNFHFVAAKLRTGRETALAWKQFDSLLAEPTGDMFWTYPATAFYFYCNDLLSEERKEAFRQVWKTWTPYRGDTENHFLMYYGTLYLLAQEWPDLPGSEWFNGKSSEENFNEAEEYLQYWIDETVRYGQTEWDSPRYLYFYITPLLTLYDFTEDPVMKRRFGMMLEYLLADYAAEYLNGNYCGAHSRDGDGSVINPRTAEATSYAQFFWEDSLRYILPDLAFAAMSNFRCPDIIRAIAHDRDEPYTHYERKRSRAKMRYEGETYTQVYKTTCMTKDYAIGSIQGGLQQPIQQHTWDVTFSSPKPNNTIFALHPYASSHELGMFFPEEPEQMESGILNSKASYGNENKWIGGSPFEKIIQKDETLRATYFIPPGTRFGHVDFFFPKSIDMLSKNTNGWIIAMFGNTFTAVHIEKADSLEWIAEPEQPCQRLRLYGDSISYVVTNGDRAQMFSGNLAALLEKKVQELDAQGDFPSRKKFLFHGPHLSSSYNSGILTMRCNGRERILDFEQNEIRTQ